MPVRFSTCGFLQFEMSASACADAEDAAPRRTKEEGEREEESGPQHRMIAAHDARALVIGMRPALGGRRVSFENQRRIPRSGPTRKIEPATTTRQPGRQAACNAAAGSAIDSMLGRPADIARATSASSDAGRARGDAAVVQITRSNSGSERRQDALDVLVLHRAEDERPPCRVRPAGFTEVGRQRACAGRVVRRVQPDIRALPRPAFQARRATKPSSAPLRSRRRESRDLTP